MVVGSCLKYLKKANFNFSVIYNNTFYFFIISYVVG